MTVTRLVALLTAAALVSVSCGGIVDPSKNVTETFNGTIVQGGQGQHPFSSQNGEFTAKLTALTPTSTALVGLAITLGATDGSCTLQSFQQNNFVSVNAPALGGQIFSGKYCVFIYDVGGIPAGVTENYTITVSHP